ncbi:MAG: Acly protein [Candidatus Levybacteria bacterium GW2011_GWB1_35_5]|nr:MAG: Acly protein [Candidatus Levybacteria bacterium GW2011_GWB1_35_5]
MIIKDKDIYLLDLAVEVDSTAEFFVNGLWEAGDFVSVNAKTKEEVEIINLSAKSQAAFKLDVLNPNGSIFMLLSGGGASIVLADEVQTQGFSKDLANYGEYSGNPNQEETYIYTKNLLSLLLKSKANKKVLIIGGGVANFTDIRITFKGIIKALEEVKNDLKKQKVKVFVRRGGPYQKAGLKDMETFLEKEKLFGKVSGPEMVLTDIALYALNYLKK